MNLPVTLLKSRLHHQGGLEKYTWQIAQAFCQKNCPVTLLTTGSVTPPFADPRLNIVSLPVAHALSYLNVRHFDAACHAFLKHHPTPIIFGLDRNRFQTHLRAGNGVHAAFLHYRSQSEGSFKRLSFRCNPLHRLILKLEKTSFEHPELKRLFTNSHLVKKDILSFYPISPEKIQVIHNGVEWHEFKVPFEHWPLQRAHWLQEKGLDPSAYQLLFVGHNFRRKGLEPLMRAMVGMPMQLLVVGKDKQEGYFRDLAQRLGLSRAVHFFNQQADIRPFYQIADALAIPSIYDPFANVTVEALAMGLFVISSKTNGGSEVLAPFSGVCIEDLSDPSSIQKALAIALQHPKTLKSSALIRNSVESLDFPHQLNTMIDACF